MSEISNTQIEELDVKLLSKRFATRKHVDADAKFARLFCDVGYSTRVVLEKPTLTF